MDYGTFQNHGEADWRRMSSLLAAAKSAGLRGLDYEQLEQLAAAHRRIVSDFAYARTHFPGSAAERQLRALAFSGHRLLATRRTPLWPRIKNFIARGFPRQFRRSLPTLYAALAIFVGATVLGSVVQILSPGFAGLFLGAERVRDVRLGELWTDQLAVAVPASTLAAQILTNNMSVALVAWAGGSLFGLVSIYVLLLNGAMFGAVLTLVWQHGLFMRLGDFISAHGPLELTLIVVAAAAGLELARGQLTLDNRPRRQSFRHAGRNSLRLAAGTLPLLFMLGIVEGFISPAPDIATSVKVLIGFTLLAAFLAYALLPAREPAARDVADVDERSLEREEAAA